MAYMSILRLRLWRVFTRQSSLHNWCIRENYHFVIDIDFFLIYVCIIAIPTAYVKVIKRLISTSNEIRENIINWMKGGVKHLYSHSSTLIVFAHYCVYRSNQESYYNQMCCWVWDLEHTESHMFVLLWNYND